MATASCTLTYVRTMDKGTNEGTATYNFGYGNAGQHWCVCYKVTVPSYTGTPSGITFTLNVNRGSSKSYQVNRNSTWKVGLDETAPIWSAANGAYTAGSAYADGLYSRVGSWYNTFSGSITSTAVSKTVTISTTSAILDSGNTFYVYLFSGANTYNSIELKSISAYVTYSSEAVTGTTLYVGTTSTPTSTTAYPTPNKRTVYYRVTGLQNPVKNYYHFKVYLSNGFSMTARSDSGYNVSGTLLTTYSNSSSSAYEFTSSFSIPNTSFPIGSNTGIVVVASTKTYPNRYWRIGARSGSTYLPVIRYIYPKAVDWFLNTVNCSAKVTGKNSVTYTFTHTTSNNPKYIKWLGAFTTSVPYNTSGHNGGSTGIWDYSCGSLNISASAANTTYSFSQSGLSAGTSYTRYLQAGAQSETPYYASNYYYGLGSVSFTTDANYTGQNISATVTGSTTATIQCGVNSKINLDGNIYYSTTSGLSSKPSTYVALGDYYSFSKNLTGLVANQPHTYYFYVYSSASGVLYQIGSVSFTTDASSYSADISASVTGATTATISMSSLSSTTNLDNYWYLIDNDGGATMASISDYFGQNRGSSINLSNITTPTVSAGSSHTVYAYVKSSASGKYYRVGSTTFTTDQSSYTATIGTSNITPVSGNITIASLSSTTNLDSNWYISTTNTTSLPTSLTTAGSAARNNAISLSREPGASTTYYAYVKSSASNKYYQIGYTTLTNPNYSGNINIKKISDTKAVCTFTDLNYTTGLNSNWYLTNPAGARFGENRNKEIVISGLTPATANTLTAKVYNLDKDTYYNAGTASVTTRATGFKACDTDIVISGARTKYEPKVVISSTNKEYYPVVYLPNYLPKLNKTVTITNLIPNIAHEESNPNLSTSSVVTVNTSYVHNGSASICIKPTSSSSEYTHTIASSVALNSSHKYYFSVWLYQPVKVGSVDIYWPIAEPNFLSGKTVSAANTWTKISHVNTRSSFTTGNYPLRIDFNNPDGTNAMYYADLMLVDLTTSFGSGSEPTKEWCDEHIPYVNTSMSLNV